MPEHKHNLPSRYDRLDDQITGPVLDSIAIDPRSHGRLHMPGEYSPDNRPPGHRVKVTSTATDNQGVYDEERLMGSAGHYIVTYDVWNYRDSLSFAELILTDEAKQVEAETPAG